MDNMLLTINPDNVDENDVADWKHRQAARAVVFNAEGKVGLLYVQKRHYYKLPGGGLEDDEDVRRALDREVEEELGVAVEVGKEVGTIVEYRTKWKLHQTSRCFVATVTKHMDGPSFTDDEKALDFQIVWVDPADAVKLLSLGKTTDYEGIFIEKRDPAFLAAALQKRIPVYAIHLPTYQVDTEPDHKALGKLVDDELRKYFMGQTILLRALGSMEHPGKSVDHMIDIIKTTGTDRYDQTRAGDRYANNQGKHIDLFALRRKITERSNIFWQLSWSFYRSPLKERGYPVKVDIMTIYDPAHFKNVAYQPVGHPDKKRDGLVFRDPTNKPSAIKAIFKIIS